MEQMDILDRHIKGISGKVLIGFASLLVTVVSTYFAITGQIKDSEVRIMGAINGNKAEQRLTDTLQNRDISDIKSKLATVVIK